MQFPNGVSTLLIVAYANGNTAVQIGPGAELTMFDPNGNKVLDFNPNGTAQAFTFGPATFGQVQIFSGGGNNAGMSFPTPPSIWGASAYTDAALLTFPGGSGATQSNALAIDGPSAGTGAGKGIYAQLFMQGASVDGSTTSAYSSWRLIDSTTAVQNHIDMLVNGFIVGQPIYTAQTESWVNVAAGEYANGWGPGGQGCMYRLMPDGTVLFKGNLLGGTTTDGTIVFTLANSLFTPTISPHVSLKPITAQVALCKPQINSSRQLQIFGLGTGTGFTISEFRYPVI